MRLGLLIGKWNMCHWQITIFVVLTREDIFLSIYEDELQINQGQNVSQFFK